MIWNIVGILVALPASMVAAIELYRLLKPGRGRRRKR